MSPTPEEVARYYAIRVPNLPQTRTAEWRGPCPIHGGQRDSFAVQAATGLWVCHSECGRGGDIPRLEQELAGGIDIGTALARVQKVLGQQWGSSSRSVPPKRGELEAVHPYVAESGKLLFEVLRFKNPKSFTQRRRGSDGKWIYDLDGVPRVLYRLPEVLEASHVIIVEGERDVETLEKYQTKSTATCNPGGAGKWAPQHTEAVRGKTCYLLPDNDQPGRKHMLSVAIALLGRTQQVSFIEIPGPYKDISDWARDHPPGEAASKEALRALYSTQQIIRCIDDLNALAKKWGLSPVEAVAPTVEIQAANTSESESDASSLRWPTPLRTEAYLGVLGEWVRLVEPHTESDPAALLIQLLVAFGNVVPRSAHFVAEADRHFTNLFAVMVGQTSKGRKGTSLGHVKRMLEPVDPSWAKRITSGLSSGEGLIWAVRDPIDNEGPGTEARDKRLLVVEPEFARVLQVTERQNNTLSSVIREAWDSGNLRVLNKNEPAQASDAHISIIGHVTAQELKRLLTSTAAANGFGNRFLWVCTKRSKNLPEGGKLHEGSLLPIRGRLQEGYEFARDIRNMERDPEARSIWIEVYGALSDGRPGLFGAVTSRAEAQTMRLATIYALLDRSPRIGGRHLLAALEVWRYCEDSARFIFGDALEDTVADRILTELRDSPNGLTRTEIREIFGRNKSSGEISYALCLLEEYGLARSERRRESDSNKRPTERWYAVRR